MRYRVKISNFSFDIEVEKVEDLQGSIKNELGKVVLTALPTFIEEDFKNRLPKSTYITLEEFGYDWEKAIQHTQQNDVSIILLQDGKKYRIKEYSRQKIEKDLFILALNKAELVFGVDYYNQWDRNTSLPQDRYIFDLAKWNSRIGLVNVDVTSAVTIEEVQPFYRCLFTNSVEKGQTGSIALINSKTNMEFGLLYSGGDDTPLTIIQKDIDFKGIIWQELKANNGGGLLVVMDHCRLEQIDPPVYFEKNLRFSKNTVTLDEGSFFQLENMFQGFGNSSNIIFVDGMTFLLPPVTFFLNYHNRYNQDSIKEANHDSYHLIHQIPKAGEKFLMSRSYTTSGEIKPDMIRNVINWEKLGINSKKNLVRELQAGDRLLIHGEEYTIKVKDRLVGNAFASEYRFNHQDSYYSAEFKLDRPLPESLPMIVEVEVLNSLGEKLLDGEPRMGFIIFKYNKNWQTNTEIDHGLDYMLASNPFGVLSYNHEEISIWARNTEHNGFYRQSRSGVGESKGYTLINCKGFEDEFAPKIPISTSGPMPEDAAQFIDFLEDLVDYLTK
ncbi:MAG: hypothetical protein HWE09_03010 [Cyclobacteriaceae bacterium]|nr:hypothetical protein [Cyclobacteriaceae bacterium]